MRKKRIVIALGHDALGTTLPEQKSATKRTAKAVVDFIKDDPHSNGRILQNLPRIYGNSHVSLFRHEPGVYWL